MIWSAVHAGIEMCAAHVPHSVHKDLYKALVCGVNVPSGKAKQAFVDTGLIHVLVVSGAHLAFLERMLPGLPKRLRLLVLFGYCWLTDWGAPVVRALVARVTRGWTEPRGWSRTQTEALASLATLALVPWWLGSRSFLMSWLCVLALSAPGPRHGWPKIIAESVRCWIFLYPFSFAAPLTVLWNALIAPTLGHLLFPASLAAMLVPRLTPVTDRLWDVLLIALERGPHAPASTTLAATSWIWWLPWAARSQTSTSSRLLSAMTHLRGAIASARRKRYGHPHASVRERCAKFGVPLFSTEDWGDVHIAL